MNTEYNFPNQHIQSRYFSLQSIKLFKEKLPENMVRSSFSIFHNKIVSINHNLENVELLLDELDFHFDVTGITETKITNSDESNPIQAFQVMFLSMCHHNITTSTNMLFSKRFLLFFAVAKHRVFHGFSFDSKHKENITFSCHHPSSDNATLPPRFP